MGAALTTTERVGTARRLESGIHGGKVYVSRNQWSIPPRPEPAPNLVDMSRDAAHISGGGMTTPSSMNWIGKEAIEKNCGVPMAMLQGKSWAPHPSNGQQ